ncbi:hypothetical protein [Micromonospora okii]|uniref:hypothetical protein n=1 Tax=Micromonospora okii TaxID=1182970 RepID=UPI001E6223EF|nr:hypothetical protein [Micromonospora okii]
MNVTFRFTASGAKIESARERSLPVGMTGPASGTWRGPSARGRKISHGGGPRMMYFISQYGTGFRAGRWWRHHLGPGSSDEPRRALWSAVGERHRRP